MDLLDVQATDYPSPQSSTARSSSPTTESGTSPTQAQPQRKKRKAWGQPVPPINPILPPRKRAKTTEEKEQRKNERILRNRRAADKSRQRQKAAVADLEQRQIQIEAENTQLKAILKQYETQFGAIAGCEFVPQLVDDVNSRPTTTTATAITPCPVAPSNSIPIITTAEANLSTTTNDMFDHASVSPAFTVSSPSTALDQSSPNLGPTLSSGEAAIFPGHVNLSGMTQYPAEILCDLQCQPETLTSRLRSMQPNRQFYEVLTLIHSLTTWMTFSETMPSIRQAFGFLTHILTTSTQLESLIRNNFHLIHILISMPSTTTQPAIFRSKLLSRLLACNPELARLLETAADDALQRTVRQDRWAEDPESRWIWASLMAIKWNVRRMEHDHGQIRADIRAGCLDRDKWNRATGVDVRSVETTMSLWESHGSPSRAACSNTNPNLNPNTISGDEKIRTASSAEVH